MNHESRKTQVLKNFTQLDPWKEGHMLVLMIYKINNTFPNYYPRKVARTG